MCVQMFKYLYANELMDLGFEEEAVKYATSNYLHSHRFSSIFFVWHSNFDLQYLASQIHA